MIVGIASLEISLSIGSVVIFIYFASCALVLVIFLHLLYVFYHHITLMSNKKVLYCCFTCAIIKASMVDFSRCEMKNTGKKMIKELICRYPSLAVCEGEITAAAEMLCDCYKNGGKVLTLGNGGSAADALHIVGELMKCFVLDRKLDKDICDRLMECGGEDGELLVNKLEAPLPAISLLNETSLETAYANDTAPELAFAQQVLGLGNKGDVLIAISTSGNSRNAVLAAKVARAKGVKVISMTGDGGGKLRYVSDVTVAVPDCETYRVQELHLPIYHALCLILEEEFFGDKE